MAFFSTFVNIFRIPELRRKIFFTFGLLCIYRIGFAVPLPGVNQEIFAETMKATTEGGGAFGQMLEYFSVFTGGSLQKSTLFSLGNEIVLNLFDFFQAHTLQRFLADEIELDLLPIFLFHTQEFCQTMYFYRGKVSGLLISSRDRRINTSITPISRALFAQSLTVFITEFSYLVADGFYSPEAFF